MQIGKQVNEVEQYGSHQSEKQAGRTKQESEQQIVGDLRTIN